MRAPEWYRRILDIEDDNPHYEWLLITAMTMATAAVVAYVMVSLMTQSLI